MPMAISAVESAHRSLALGHAVDLPRQRCRLPRTTLHILQGALPGNDILGYKSYTSNRSGNRFFIHLFDANTGEAIAIIAADFLGMMRTAAASAVATRYLAGQEAKIAGVFGAGWQAEGHLEALAAVRTLQEIKVFARNQDKLKIFCSRMSERLGLPVRPMSSSEETVRGSDIVGTVTTAAEPLFDGQWLDPGTHINAVGSNSLIRREIDEKTVLRADRIVVDARATALAEAGDLLPALEKGRIQASALTELGQIIVADQGRANATEITLFESQGLAIQDLAVALEVLQAAKKTGLGCVLPF